MRTVKIALSLGVLGVLLLSGGSALGTTTANTPAAGPVQVFGTPSSNGNNPDTILVTGAIADYGKTTKINNNNRKATLHKGTFIINISALNTQLNSASPTFNAATCSGTFAGTAPVQVSNGTGLYKGISGTVNITLTVAIIGPRITSGSHKGQCNPNHNAKPVAEYGSILGAGTVQFS